MRGLERLGALNCDPDCLLCGNRSISHTLPQRGALNQFRGDEPRPILFADFEDGHNVGMIQRGSGFCLELKPRYPLRIMREMCMQNLQRNCSVQPGVTRPENFSHAPQPKRRQDLVRTKFVSDTSSQ